MNQSCTPKRTLHAVILAERMRGLGATEAARALAELAAERRERAVRAREQIGWALAG